VIISRFGLATLVVAGALALTGCAATTTGAGGASAGASGELLVVATTTQVADLARNVIGDTAGVTLTQLIQPNQTAHSYDPSAADLTTLARADVLVISGAGLEEWLDDATSASGFGGVTIDASTGIPIVGGNPHVWTDVSNAEAMTRTIATGLAAASSANADRAADFATNAAAYQTRLAALDDWIRAGMAPVPAAQRLLVSNHDAFGYFTTAYGITYVGSVIPGFDDNAEPSATDIDELVTKIRATGVRAVFSEASISPKAADTIAKQADVTVYSGEAALYGDSLGPAGSDGASYIASQVHNVRLILESWGVTPTAVPVGLGD
jgi:ABC-type Zn uptake system ZnuABC Zn-binding protein ZnuA